MMTLLAGQQAEQKALNYLVEKGFKLQDQNYRCFLGEIDLIMRDGNYLVFIEVRSRTHRQYGGGIASITHAKKQKIMKTASHYLMKYKLHGKVPLRFDVVGIDGKSGDISWIKDAFGTNY